MARMARAAERGVHEQESIARQLITLARINNVNLREFPRILQALGMALRQRSLPQSAKSDSRSQAAAFALRFFISAYSTPRRNRRPTRYRGDLVCQWRIRALGVTYLEVQNLLETKPDPEITREDYIQIVRRLDPTCWQASSATCASVGMQISGKTSRRCSSPATRAPTASENCSSEKIFARVRGDRADRYMGDLVIHPFGERRGFSPKVRQLAA